MKNVNSSTSLDYANDVSSNQIVKVVDVNVAIDYVKKNALETKLRERIMCLEE